MSKSVYFVLQRTKQITYIMQPTLERLADIGSLGYIMVELMEPETYMLDPQSINLQRPGLWKDQWGIRSFLEATQNQPLQTLMSVSR
jgi:hypothetical protein